MTLIKRHSSTAFLALLFFAILVMPICCTVKQDHADAAAEDAAFRAALQKHLDAVSNKDLPALESTLSPAGDMQLILPDREITHTVDDFLSMHREWFQDTSWSFETKILNVEIGRTIGTATTEIVYREPERNGKPYFNRLAVSYTLRKMDGAWYVIKDHACSLEKSEN